MSRPGPSSAAARINCANNLKQLGLAAHSYHDAHFKFPSGRVSADIHENNMLFSDDNDHTGFTLLLPYIEQENVSRNILAKVDIPGVGSFDQAWFYHQGMPTPFGPLPLDPPYYLMIQQNLKTFLCPGNRSEGTLDVSLSWAAFGFDINKSPLVAPTDYKMCKGRNAFLDHSAFIGSPGSPITTTPGIPPVARGIFDGNSNTRIGDIMDGTSNTFLFGEAAGNNRLYLARDPLNPTQPYISGLGSVIPIDQSWGVPVVQFDALAFGAQYMFDSNLGVTALTGGFPDPANPGVELNPNSVPMNDRLVWPGVDYSTDGHPNAADSNYNHPGFPPYDTVGGFRSIHSGGANFCNADGSVRFISQTIAQRTYEALSTHQGGEIIDASGL